MITVTGKGEVKQAPEQVVVTLGVELREKVLDDLVDKTDKASADIIYYLLNKDISAGDIQTSYFSIYPYYTSSGSEYGSTEVDFYTSTKTVTFTLRNISNYDNVMDGLYERGINRVNDITFKVEDVQEQRLQARKYAVGNATESAKLFAGELGVKLTGVYMINDQTYDDGAAPVPMAALKFAREAADSAGSSGPSIAGGEITISASVSVSFFIN